MAPTVGRQKGKGKSMEIRFRVVVFRIDTNEVVEIFETDTLHQTERDAWFSAMDWLLNRQLAATEQARVKRLVGWDE